jgi:hypothetical protein
MNGATGGRCTLRRSGCAVFCIGSRVAFGGKMTEINDQQAAKSGETPALSRNCEFR